MLFSFVLNYHQLLILNNSSADILCKLFLSSIKHFRPNIVH